MAKRFTDTTIWKNQRWFKKLTPLHKLSWKYITDLCDHAGIWKIDLGELMDDLGLEEFSLDSFVDACNVDFDKKTGKKIYRERIIIINNDYLWVTGFMKFQYEGKSRKIDGTSKVTISALDILNSFGLLQVAIAEKKFFELKISDLSKDKPLQTPPNPSKPHTCPSEPLQGVKDKDKDKGKGLKDELYFGKSENLFENPPPNPDSSLVGQMCALWIGRFKTYTEDRQSDTEGMGKIVAFMMRQSKSHDPTNNDFQIKCLNTLELIADQVEKDPFWINKPLKSIGNNIQEFYNKIKNPINGKSKAGEAAGGTKFDNRKLKDAVLEQARRRGQV